MPYTLVAPPTEEPYSLEEAKAHLRVETGADDNLITGLILAARQYVERETNKSLVTQTWKLTLDRFPQGPIHLGHGPVSAVGAFAYRDTNGEVQTVDPSTFVTSDLPAEYPEITPTPLGPFWPWIWPYTLPQPGAVSITFTAGFGDASDVPQDLKQAMLLIIGHWYNIREAVVLAKESSLVVPMAADAIISNNRIPVLA